MAPQLHEQLEKLGFSDKEAVVYLALLQRQSASAAEIADYTGFQRTTVYSVLEKLRKDGLVTLLNSTGRKRYLCESPERFGERLDAQRKIFWNVLPELRENASLFTQKNAFSYHEGLAGIWHVYDAMLREKGELRQLIPTITEARIVGSEKIDSFIRARVKRGISVRAIIQNDKELEKEALEFTPSALATFFRNRK